MLARVEAFCVCVCEGEREGEGEGEIPPGVEGAGPPVTGTSSLRPWREPMRTASSTM